MRLINEIEEAGILEELPEEIQRLGIRKKDKSKHFFEGTGTKSSKTYQQKYGRI